MMASALQVAHDFATSATGRHDGPHGPLDVVAVFVAAFIVAGVIVLSLRFLLRPGEHDPEHIKRQILERHGPASVDRQPDRPST